MKLPPIYKRTSTGKVQEWIMEIEGNKFRTISGQTEGKKFISEWTICAGKNIGKSNETSPEEQAAAEGQAKRRLKLEKEYRENIDSIDSLEFKEPLRAKEYKNYKDSLSYPLWYQPKLDGVRCVVNAAGLWSRKGKPFISCPHIFESLKPLFLDNPNLVLDGELYNHDLFDDFDQIISLVKQQKPTEQDFINSEKLVKFYIFDICDIETNFEKRSLILSNIFRDNLSNINKYCVKVETSRAEDELSLDMGYEKCLYSHYEGQMVRTNSPYEFKRSKNLLKRKEFITEEFLVLDIKEGIGGRANMAGKTSCITKDGISFDAGLKGGVEFYKRMWRDKDSIIGKKYATIRYQNLTPKGTPRFPVCIAIRDYE